MHLYTGDRVIFLAGKRYRKHLAADVAKCQCSVIVPMAGLKIGRQLQWLSARNASKPRPLEPAP